MTAATGLGLLDVAILDAYERAGGAAVGPFVKAQRVLHSVLDATGIGSRTAYERLCDLARPWVVHLRLIDFHGNLGSPSAFGPASPHHTECRLTPLGTAALASERGDLGPLPIGLINGTTHVDGCRPPVDPIRALAAIRAASGATDDEIAAILGGPSFPTGCTVDVDASAWAAGSPTEATLTARIDADADRRLVISHLPPECTADEIIDAIQSRAHGSWQALVGHDDTNPRGTPRRPPIRDVSDRSRNGDVRVVVDLVAGADPEEARRFLLTLRGVRRTLHVQVGAPIVDLVRDVCESDPATLEERLDIVETAIGS